MHSSTEEDYIKTIFNLTGPAGELVSTNSIAHKLETSAASVTDMLKRLSDKKLLYYEKYYGARLTAKGEKIARTLVRKHRLWEVFLVDKLGFKWDEVHDIAEQLEHVRSEPLIARLDEYLSFPRFDPHGDPIPDEDGNMDERSRILLAQLPPGKSGQVVGVKDSSEQFLRYLDSVKVTLGSRLSVSNKIEYDGSMILDIEKHGKLTISNMVAQNLWVIVH